MSMYYSDGSAFHEITPSTIGALPYSIQEQTDVSNLASSTGLYTNNVANMTVGTGDEAVALPFSQWGMIFTNKDIGTPFQLAMADSGDNYVYKRRLTSTSWEKLSAGYADSAGTATNATNSSTVNGHTVNSDVPANLQTTLNNKIGTDNREVVVSSTQPTNSNCQLWIKV